MQTDAPLRIVLAKVGLDGHDRGIKVVARGLRDAGFHVIYSGLWQTIEDVVRTVGDEDADYLGISILSGAHMTLAPRLLEALAQAQLQHVGVLIGGIIPAEDEPQLLELGILRVFGPGTPINGITDYLREQGVRTPAMVPFPAPEAADRQTLARRITCLARGHAESAALAAATGPQAIAITGSGGVGKSTLVSKLVEEIRDRGQRVAVLACDPQSSVTGGALLGDRVRMPSRPADDGVFIRSLATPSGQQSIAAHLPSMVQTLGAYGFDVVLIETVGAGQGDIAVREIADQVVLLVQPETGDDMQWEKAGLMEVADVILVHKADLPGADRVVARIQDIVSMAPGQAPPVLAASAAKGEGIGALWDALQPSST